MYSVNEIVTSDIYFEMDEYGKFVKKKSTKKLDDMNFLKEKDDPLRFDRIKILIWLEAIMILDQLLEGTSKLPSFIGIKKCSFPFWFVFSLFAVLCIIFPRFFYQTMKEEAKLKISKTNPKVFKITSEEGEKNLNKIILICFISGIISGLLGVGGGIVMAPLMLELGIEPRIAAATSNFLLIFTSFASCALFTLSGQLILDYAIFFAVICGFFSLIGSSYISEFISKNNKSSVLIFSLCGVMVVSLLILPINGIRHIIYDNAHGIPIFEFTNYCPD